MSSVTRAELFRFRGQTGREWDRAYAWFRSVPASELTSFMTRLSGRDGCDARKVLRSVTEAQAQCLILAFNLVVAELAIRAETEGPGDG